MTKKKLPSQKAMRWLKKADRVLKFSADAFGTVAEIGKNPGISSTLSAGMKLTQIALSTSIFDPFRTFNWPTFYPGNAFQDEFFCLLERFPKKTETKKDSENTTIYNVYGHTIVRPKNLSYVHYEEGDLNEDKIMSLMARAVWDFIGSPVMLLVSKKSSITTLRCLPAADLKVLPSKRSTEIEERIRKFYDAGVNRSLFFHGPPGTGKTSIINNIGSKFGKRVLIIDVSDLAYGNGTAVTRFILSLSPDVLIINDIDKFYNCGQMLSQLEQLNSELRLFLVSANNVKCLPPEAIRCGRFDEMLEILYLDEEVAMSLLDMHKDQMPEFVYNSVIKWPAAFIAELGKRIKFLGKEHFIEEFFELRKRVVINAGGEVEEELGPEAEKREVSSEPIPMIQTIFYSDS